MSVYSLCVPRGFGGRAGYEVSTGHVFPQCVPAAIILIGGGARDKGLEPGQGASRGFYYMQSPTPVYGGRIGFQSPKSQIWTESMPSKCHPSIGIHVLKKRTKPEQEGPEQTPRMGRSSLWGGPSIQVRVLIYHLESASNVCSHPVQMQDWVQASSVPFSGTHFSAVAAFALLGNCQSEPGGSGSGTLCGLESILHWSWEISHSPRHSQSHFMSKQECAPSSQAETSFLTTSLPVPLAFKPARWTHSPGTKHQCWVPSEWFKLVGPQEKSTNLW